MPLTLRYRYDYDVWTQRLISIFSILWNPANLSKKKWKKKLEVIKINANKNNIQMKYKLVNESCKHQNQNLRDFEGLQQRHQLMGILSQKQ